MPNIKFNYLKRLVLILVAVALCSITFISCSSQWHHPYNQITPEFNINGQSSVAVVVYDNRQMLKDNKIAPQQVGALEPLTGDKINIYTASGRTLAEDIARATCNGFTSKKHKCEFLIAKTSNKHEHVNIAVKRFHPLRVVYLSINEWFAEIFINPKVKYNFEMEVYNPDLTPMSIVELNGEEKIPLRGLNPAQSASTSVPKTLEEILETLINNPRINNSLSAYDKIDELGARVNY